MQIGMQLFFIKHPYFYIALCLITGILIGKMLIHFPTSLWFTIVFFFSSLILYVTIRTSVLYLSIFCTLISAGSLRYHLSTEIYEQDHISAMDAGKISQFSGMIIDCQYGKDNRNKYVVSIEQGLIENTLNPICGKIILYTKSVQHNYEYGDRIQVKAALQIPTGKRNPGQFDYKQYLYNQNVFFIAKVEHADSIICIERYQGNWFVHSVISPLRSYCQRIFQSYFDEKTSGLIMALILGEKQGLGQEMIENFKHVGVVHVLAISGLHVGFIITFIFSLLSLLRLNHHSKIWGLLIILIIYIIIIRFKTPVIRASSMAIFYLLGQILERKISPYNIIFAAMTLILLIDPRELFNPGFHFSFMAVLSIIYGYEKFDQLLPLNRYLEKRIKNNLWLSFFQKWIWFPFLVSLAAVIGTSPLTLYYYGLFPVYALLANLIVIPLTGLIVFFSLFLLLIGGLSDILATGLGMVIQLINQLLQYVVRFFADIPYSSVITPIPSCTQVMLIYIIMLFGINIKRNFKVVVFLLFLLVLIFAVSLKSEENKHLQVVFLDVGQGDAAFIRFPNQKTMLIDAGNRSFQWDQGEKIVLPFLQYLHALHINYLIGSHPHNDHIGGFMALLNNVMIDTLVMSAYQFNSKFYKDILSYIDQNNIPLKLVEKGDLLIPDPSCRVYVLHPDSMHLKSETFSGAECNNSSVVLKVTYGKNNILFTGDLEESGEDPLLQYEGFLESEILKIGHHGSITSTSEELLKSVNPIFALISVAKKNKFKHPSPRTLERLTRHGIKTCLTSEEGAIVFTISPEKITRVAWR